MISVELLKNKYFVDTKTPLTEDEAAHLYDLIKNKTSICSTLKNKGFALQGVFKILNRNSYYEHKYEIALTKELPDFLTLKFVILVDLEYNITGVKIVPLKRMLDFDTFSLIQKEFKKLQKKLLKQ